MSQLKKYTLKFIIILGTVLFLSCGQNQDKQDMTATTNKMNDTERLLNSTFPFVEDLLKKHGEFFPLASAVKINDSIAQVATYDGDDRPLSNTLIENLKISIKSQQRDYKSVTIFYDVRVLDPNTQQKTDAVAVFAENKYDTTAYIFYYPYIMTTDGQIKFSLSWKNITEKEIFNN